MKRRDFLKAMGGAAAVGALPRITLADPTPGAERPNILWISTEDISPSLGCYGDKYAVTPNLDKFASQGVRYDRCFTHAPVCAPSRSGIITGMYPTTIGTHLMRCKGVPPPYVRCFTEYLRAAGYFCTNQSKTDYQFDPPTTAWDVCGGAKAHWRTRPEGKPFFSVINLTITHESQIRNRKKAMLDKLAQLGPDERHDPARAVLPPYFPDTPAVRQDWAQYYDIITLMDKQVAEILQQLEEDGLAEDTIVWFWGDHGQGMSRGKRWLYDSGIHVPLIIRVPEKWRKRVFPDNPDALKPGSVNGDLVAFVDFAPTMLSLCGVQIPGHMQGRAFLGPQKAEPREYVYAARDRMDETYDIIRAVRDKRFKYIRNYMPHLTYAQDIDYMNQMPTMQEMRRLNAEGRLVGPQKNFFLEQKPIEELYDTETDLHEVNNLAGDPKYKDVLARMRTEHLTWAKQTGDVGLIPEPELDEMQQSGGPYEATSPPGVTPTQKGDATIVALTSLTPGASIACRTGRSKDAGWQLYTEPIVLDPGMVLTAKACRLGFRDSKDVRYEAGGPAIPAEPSTARPHWREQMDKSDLLERLRALKAHDVEGEKARGTYLKALNDPDASVRYWGVVGLHVLGKEDEAIGKLLNDPSPIVRIAAAEAMCDWGREKEARPVLLDAAKHESQSVRHNAAIALGRIGEKARPALPEIKDMLKDKYGYVKRVTQYTVKRLEGEAQR
ncbi:MAG: sulfatase-like hydrolase/transferase [Planctomycetota bacterium]